MMTSVNSSSVCSSSYSMFTSHLPRFSEGQQLTGGRERERKRGRERGGERGGGKERDRERGRGRGKGKEREGERGRSERERGREKVQYTLYILVYTIYVGSGIALIGHQLYTHT